MTRKEIKEQAARFGKYVEWSDEDNVFIGRCPELFDGGVHGRDEANGYAELCQTVEEWVELIHDDGKPLPKTSSAKQFSGEFMVRIDPQLHHRAVLKAKAEGESLNQFVAHAIAKA